MPTDAPTVRDLNAALAKARGMPVRNIRVRGGTETVEIISDNLVFSDGVWTREELERYGAPPPYSSSLDALARDIEPEIRRRGLEEQYAEEIMSIVAAAASPHQAARMLTLPADKLAVAILATAPASVRALAAWRVLSESQ